MGGDRNSSRLRNFLNDGTNNLTYIFPSKPSKSEIYTSIKSKEDNNATGQDQIPIGIVKRHYTISPKISYRFLQHGEMDSSRKRVY